MGKTIEEQMKEVLLKKIDLHMIELEQLLNGSGGTEANIKRALTNAGTVQLCENDFIFMAKIERRIRRFNEIATGKKIEKRSTANWNKIKEQVLLIEALKAREYFIGDNKMSEKEYEEYLRRFVEDNEPFGEKLKEAKPQQFMELAEELIKNDLLLAYALERSEGNKKRDVSKWIGAVEQIIEAAKNRREFVEFIDTTPKRENENKMTLGEYNEYIGRLSEDVQGFAERLNEARNEGQRPKEDGTIAIGG